MIVRGGIEYCVHYGPITLTPEAAQALIRVLEEREARIKELTAEVAELAETGYNLRAKIKQLKESKNDRK